ncbi:MAG: SPOR domain-containing protein, partial [Candidatus Binatia bacterium]
MAENRRGKDSRYYLSRGQMIILGGTFTLASIVVFLIGMMVGKELEERKILKKDEPLVKMPVKPAGGTAGTAAKNDEITFYDTLAKSRDAQALPEQPAKVAKPAAKTPRAEVKETKTAAKPDSQLAKLADRKAEKVQPAAESAKSESADAEVKVWRAQVDTFPDERSAKLLVDRLKNKGYNAYVNQVEFRGSPWYRVSVGKYGSREEADKVVGALKGK